MTLLKSSLLLDHGATVLPSTQLQSLLTTYFTTHKPSPSSSQASHPFQPPPPPPRYSSLLFETTTKKLTRHRTSLEKQLLLKQLYSKLQTTKRHGMILYDHHHQFGETYPKHSQWSPPCASFRSPSPYPEDDDDDDIPLGTLLSQDQINQFQRSSICTI